MATSNDPKKPANDDVKQMLTDLSVKLIKAEAKRLTAEMAPPVKVTEPKNQDKPLKESKVKSLMLAGIVVASIAAWVAVLRNEPPAPARVRATPVAVSRATCTRSVTSEVKDSSGHVVTTRTDTQTGPCQSGSDSASSAATNVGAHVAKWAILSLF